MSTNKVGAQFSALTNVCIRSFDENGKFLQEVKGSNRVTKIALLDLVRFTGGYLNPTMPNYNLYLSDGDEGFPFYPRYVALGSNVATADSRRDVSTTVNVNDSHLLSEYKVNNVSGNNTNELLRVRLQQNNVISNLYSDPYIKLTLKCLIQNNIFESYMNDEGETEPKDIREVGLFTKKSGDNCWARIVLPTPVTKYANSVLDITWDLIFVSMKSEVPYDSEERISKDKRELRTSIASCEDMILAINRKDESKRTENEAALLLVYNEANAVFWYDESLDSVVIDIKNKLNKAIESVLNE